LYAVPHKNGFLAISRQHRDEDEAENYEVYGESPARPLFSASLEMPERRARVLALSELRLDPEAEPLQFEAILPKPLAAPAGEDLARTTLLYATALAGACPRLSQPVNLLPEEQRAVQSRWLWIPTIALASILLLVLGALGMSGPYQNRRYLATLEQERRRIEPRAKQAVALERDIAVMRNRAQTLDNFRARSRDDMDALNELTRTLPPPTWLTGLQLTRTQLSITGETDQATPLLKALDGTKQFKRSEFTLPMARLAHGENFSIRASREGVAP
jgi:Tfp pilus assembly protein PilN